MESIRVGEGKNFSGRMAAANRRPDSGSERSNGREEATATLSEFQLAIGNQQLAISNQQSEEIPLETFFHKIVMIRNNLRVSGSIRASSASGRIRRGERVPFGALAERPFFCPARDFVPEIRYRTSNIKHLKSDLLFKNKDDQFRTGA